MCRFPSTSLRWRPNKSICYPYIIFYTGIYRLHTSVKITIIEALEKSLYLLLCSRPHHSFVSITKLQFGRYSFSNLSIYLGVSLGKKLTESFILKNRAIDEGAPQGSVLGPPLFIRFPLFFTKLQFSQCSSFINLLTNYKLSPGWTSGFEIQLRNKEIWLLPICYSYPKKNSFILENLVDQTGDLFREYHKAPS